MNDALLGTTLNSDRFFDLKSVRLRTGWLGMNYDKSGGAGSLSAYLAKYGTDGNSTVTVECSADGGASWFQLGGSVSVNSTVLTLSTFAVNTNANVRFRFSKTGTTRVNIDNVSITDYTGGGTPPELAPLAPQSVRVGETLQLGLAITPTDGDAVVYTNAAASEGVAGAWSLEAGLFSYAPAAADVGSRGFTFAVADKDGTNAQALAVTVRRASVAAVPMTGRHGSYAQDFNALAGEGAANEWDNAATPLEAWYAYTATAVTGYRAGDGGGTAGGLYSWGATPDRALGSLASSGNDYRFGVAFTNATGFTVTNLTVAFTAEQWRVGANAQTNALVFEQCVTNAVLPLTQGVWQRVDALGFDSPLVTNEVQAAGAAYAAAPREAALLTPVPPGGVALLRWLDVDDPGNDHGFGVDDLRVTWVTDEPVPGTLIQLR